MIYKITADSASNVHKLDKIDFSNVPLKIITDVKEYVDDKSLNIVEMIKDLKSYKGRSSTACPSIGEWLESFGEADRVFAVTITSNLSGSYAAALEAKKIYEENNPYKKVCVVDTLSAGGEMQLIVEKIQEFICEGMDFEAICEKIEEYKKKTHLVFSLESLKNLANNGRVSHLVAAAAGVLGIRVVGRASSVGTLEPMHKVRGEKKAIETLYSEMKNNGFIGGKVCLTHCFNENAAQTLKNIIMKDFPKCDISVVQMNGLCTFYAEQGGMLIGFEG